jgi:hypothetical protein
MPPTRNFGTCLGHSLFLSVRMACARTNVERCARGKALRQSDPNIQQHWRRKSCVALRSSFQSLSHGSHLFQRACCIGADCGDAASVSDDAGASDSRHLNRHQLHDDVQLAVGELPDHLRYSRGANTHDSSAFRINYFQRYGEYVVLVKLLFDSACVPDELLPAVSVAINKAASPARRNLRRPQKQNGATAINGAAFGPFCAAQATPGHRTT